VIEFFYSFFLLAISISVKHEEYLVGIDKQ